MRQCGHPEGAAVRKTHPLFISRIAQTRYHGWFARFFHCTGAIVTERPGLSGGPPVVTAREKFELGGTFRPDL